MGLAILLSHPEDKFCTSRELNTLVNASTSSWTPKDRNSKATATIEPPISCLIIIKSGSSAYDANFITDLGLI